MTIIKGLRTTSNSRSTVSLGSPIKSISNFSTVVIEQNSGNSELDSFKTRYENNTIYSNLPAPELSKQYSSNLDSTQFVRRAEADSSSNVTNKFDQISIKAVSSNISEILASSTQKSIKDILIDVANGNQIVQRHGGTTGMLPSIMSIYNRKPVLEDKNILDFGQTYSTKTPYENLTGLSVDRAELICSIDYKPVFYVESADDENEIQKTLESDGSYYSYLTSEGMMLDTHRAGEDVKISNVNLINRVFYHLPPDIKESVKQNFAILLTRLRQYSNFINKTLSSIEDIKDKTNLKDKWYTVNIDEFHEKSLHRKQSNTRATNLLNDNLSKSLNTSLSLPQEMRLSDCLTFLGYSKSNVELFYTSTKLWYQTLLELKYLFKYHSKKLLDQNNDTKENDVSPISILKNERKYFKISSNISDIPGITKIANYQLDDISAITDPIENAFKSLYDNSQGVSNDSKLLAVIDILSRELKYSNNLNNADVRRLLSESYNYIISADASNSSFTDFILGNIPDSIINTISNNPRKALSQLAYQNVNNDTSVLTFEQTYIKNDNAELTPGSSWYIDDVLNVKGNSEFNVSHIQKLLTDSIAIDTTFDTLNEKFNLDGVDQSRTSLATLKFDSTKTMWNLLISDISSNKNSLNDEYMSDATLGLFRLANKNSKLKTLLFMYTLINFFSSSNDSNASTSIVSKKILKTIQTNIVNYTFTILPKNLIAKTSNISNVAAFSRVQLNLDPNVEKEVTDQISEFFLSSFVGESNLQPSFKLIDTWYKRIFNYLKSNDSIIIKNDQAGISSEWHSRTLYNGLLDTTIYMIVFDMLCTAFDIFGGTNFEYQKVESGKKVILYTKSIEYMYKKLSLMTSRVNDDEKIRFALYTVTSGTIKKLIAAIKNFSTNINSESSKSELKDLLELYDNDSNMLKLMLSEQQSASIANSVESFISSFSNLNDQAGRASLVSNLKTKNDDYTNIIKVQKPIYLDEKFIKIFYHWLNDIELGTKKGNNKKIFTIGIPAGTYRSLKTRVTNSRLRDASAYSRKQNDIIKVLIHKLDVLNPDVIYKPLEYKFEISRYACLDSNFYGDPASVPASLKSNSGSGIDYLIPTLDKITSIQEGNNATYYWNKIISNSNNSSDKPYAFAGNSYSFLSEIEKDEILRNTLTSFMLENYIKLMTGLDTAENNFVIDKSTKKIVSSLTRNMNKVVLEYFTAKSIKQNSSISNSAFPTIRNTVSTKNLVRSNQNLLTSQVFNTINSKQILNMSSVATTINTFSQTVNETSDYREVCKKIISPKIFDRVFNIIVDPDDFQVDIDNMSTSASGVEAIKKLNRAGILINPDTASGQKGFDIGSTQKYVQTKLDKSSGDISINRYFITIESYGEDVI